MQEEIIDIKGIPFNGGCITAVDNASIPTGGYSYVKNIRPLHPGFETRKGCRKKHSTADGTNQVMTLYQFSKSKVAEQHFYAQMSDGDVLEATDAPPTVTSGVFGSEVFSGSSGSVPASWGVIGDKCVYSNGVDNHQIYGGTSSYVDKFIVFKDDATIPTVPQGGENYTLQVTDGNSSTVAVLDSLSTYALHDCIFFRTSVPCKSITLTVSTGNDNASVASVYYWKNDSTWAEASTGWDDGTDVGGDTLKQSGTMAWTAPSDIMEKYAFGSCGWWYQIRFSAALDSEVEVSSVTFSSDWEDIVNIWDGVMVYAVEVQTEGTSTYAVNTASSVDLDAHGSGKKIMIASTDPIEGIYIDPGTTPNATGTALTSLKYWDGDSYVTVGTTTDESNGMSNAGWLTFPRQSGVQAHQFEGSVYAYWYELIWNAEIAADVTVSINVMPYFDIAELGNGYTCAVWKERMVTSFDLYGSYVYFTKKNYPFVYNGADYGLLKVGDGRSNRVLAMHPLYNELIVWQEEKGVEGGCTTVLEGYSPTTFGRLLLDSSIGIVNAKAKVSVPGVLTSTQTDESIHTLIFWISRKGICATNGKQIWVISDDIRNYFDPKETSTCIRYGYEDQHCIGYDSMYNGLRIGLVTGASATTPNTFLFFDIIDKKWYFDDPAQEFSCFVEVESATSSGGPPVTALAGGVDDGFVYQVNYGDDDTGEVIDAYLTMQLQIGGEMISLRELMVRAEAENTGSLEVEIKANELLQVERNLSLVAENPGQEIRRHRFNLNVTDHQISVTLRNDDEAIRFKLYDMGLRIQRWRNA